ncbi:unnamed protein product [Brassicogethes aeneus]|uniref:Uncharacterized protein n=1 Tax=Brassicogethes aeneus TaxID=1431903 RepID=A0A9P0BJR7_BRAAE|nr:unnamed protein product [Brassicogethes aeneus]
MKLPFHTLLGPVLKNNHRHIKEFCANPGLTFSPLYVGVLSVLGMVLSVFDMLRIINCGPTLPGYLWKTKSKPGKLISPETERDFKLICLVWSFEYYASLLVGLFTNNPIFFLPFLLLYALIVFLEFMIYCMRVFTDGINFSKTSLIMSMFMIYNWMTVFCTFIHTTTKCDL